MAQKKQVDEAALAWIAEQEQLMAEGENLLRQASDEALEYVIDAIEHINDKAWRKMVMSTQSVEMGVGVGIAEHLIPIIYQEMERSLHKNLKVSKDTAMALRHIYIGRVVKNIRKALNERNQ